MGRLVKNIVLVVFLVLYVSEANCGLFGSIGDLLSETTSNLLSIPSRLISKFNSKLSADQLSPSALEEEWSTCGLLRKYDYDCEVHKVTTPDGYILNMFRVLCPNANIPKTTSRPAVFLMHGLLYSSSSWVISPEYSLAMTMCDSGYDVWLGNARGNEYSSEHIYLNTSSPNYYMFSWTEIAAIDLPTMMNYTLAYTKQNKLSFVGHSQGTTVFLALASSNPTLASTLISSAHLLAPNAFTTGYQGLSLEFAPIFGVPDPNSSYVEVELSENLLPVVENVTGQTYCTDIKPPQRICNEIYNLLFGDSDVSNKTGLVEILNVFPSSASTRQLKHLLQGQTSSKFRLYDFGETINVAKYLSEEPPQYPLADITVPTFLYYSDKDLLASEEDVKRLISSLNPNTLKGTHFFPGWYHLDYIIANNVNSLLYSIVMDNINKN